jgi:hypothetical protein
MMSSLILAAGLSGDEEECSFSGFVKGSKSRSLSFLFGSSGQNN